MSPEGMSKIKSKLQELVALVKDETAGDTQEIKEDLLHVLDKVKIFFEERLQAVENKYGENIKTTLQDKLSKGIAQKDDLVGKAADTVTDAMNKLKEKITSNK